MSRSRAPGTPSPVYPSCGALENYPKGTTLYRGSSGKAAGGINKGGRICSKRLPYFGFF